MSFLVTSHSRCGCCRLYGGISMNVVWVWLLSTLWLAPLLSSVWAGTIDAAAAVAGATGQVELDTASSDSGITTKTDQDQPPSMLELVQRQFDWVRSKGGFVHEQFIVRPYNAEDPDSPLGVFAGVDLKENELLFRVPRECLITSFEDDMCDTVDALMKEWQLGNASQYEPYVTYLKRQPYGQLPTMWSKAGQELLLEILDQEALPPSDATHVEWGCHDDSAPLVQQQASMLLVQRGWDEVLIPIYDLLGHRNGPHYWLNTKMASEEASVHNPNEPIEVYAARDIRQGEELYGSYDHCNDCGGRVDYYGTPEILRDYGFVEFLPQKWVFHQQGVSFTLDYTYTYNDQGQVVDYDPNEETWKLYWHSKPLDATRNKSDAKRLNFFVQQLQRLQQLQQQKLSTPEQQGDIPNHEWTMIVQYHQALVTAIQKLIHDVTTRKEHEPTPGKEQNTQASASVEATNDRIVPGSRRQDDSVNHGQRLIEWIRSNGGFVSGKIDVRRIDPNDAQSAYGVFATESIRPKEMILSIPRTCVVWTPNDNSCDTVQLLAQEFRLANESQFEPYITYLLDSQPYGQLPSLWSAAGKEHLLNLILDEAMSVNMEDDDDDDDDEEEEGFRGRQQVLPPRHLVDPEWIGCQSFQDTTPLLDRHAAMLVHQRGWDELLIPLFDMFNHRNGKAYLNTRESHSVHDTSKDVEVEASRMIQAGEELYTTYSDCYDCGGRSKTHRFGTPETFRDYGFVERTEQKWIFPMQELVFTLDYKRQSDRSSTSTTAVTPPGVDDLALRWLTNGRPDEEDEQFFRRQIERLVSLKEDEQGPLFSRDEAVPDHEWTQILAYHHALVTALQMVIRWIEHDQHGGGGGGDKSTCEGGGGVNEDGVCQVPENRYDPLDEMFDDEGYNAYVCKVNWKFPGYDRIETVKSIYQDTLFIEHPDHHDVCFELDSTWQICGCYRPHYHEMGTHYPASFLPELKRVLWVGGGDSMLLHEIIKYQPTLELAIGLELDQKVTRASFKYFGTQPHWDQHDKVQWWYGDAAKSLLLLPKEYFGTFDLILVDLSETVMSNSVTKELDIMAALSLLLKPEGIYMKNEIYFDELSKLFKYTIQLHVYDVPILCSQSFIFGSNKIDFMKQNVTNHHIKNNLFFKPLDELDYRYFEIHDYGMNPNPERHCSDSGSDEEEVPEVQDRSPGILMILEAEKVQFAQLQSVDQVLQAIVRALQKDGLSIVSTFTSLAAAAASDNGNSLVTVVMEEGYVIARVWAEFKYVAFDIHLWSSFPQMEIIKKSLLAAMGSSGPKSSSAFRIAAGGMFGVSTWVKDSMSRGPRLPQCEAPEKEELVVREEPTNDSVVRSVIKESLALVLEDQAIAVVVCGPEKGEKQCSSLDVISEHSSIGKVVTLWTCANIAGGVEFQPDSGNQKFDCEKRVLQTLKDLHAQVGVLVLDPSAEYAMAQILHRIASRSNNKKTLFSEKLLVLAPILDAENEEWRRVFVDQFRNIYRKEPLFRAAVLYNTTTSSLEMETFLSGDDRFIEHVHQVTEALEANTDLVGETRTFEAGRFRKVKHPNPTLFALPSHYDQSDPFDQWSTQQPLGQQTVLQLDTAGIEDASLLTKESIRTSLETVLTELQLVDENQDIYKILQEFKNIGDGCILFMAIKGGNLVVLWDGRENITVNMFTLEQDEGLATNFVVKFQEQRLGLATMLRDEMPRGYGRVVNFAKDIGGGSNDDRPTPSWAMSVVNDDGGVVADAGQTQSTTLQ